MCDKLKYIFNKLIDFMKIVFCVTIIGLISVAIGEFCGRLIEIIHLFIISKI